MRALSVGQFLISMDPGGEIHWIPEGIHSSEQSFSASAALGFVQQSTKASYSDCAFQ